MKKLALMLVVAAFAVTPAMAGTKKAPKMTAAEAQNDASWRLFRDSLPLVLPTWAMPVYFHVRDEEAKKTSKKKM